MDEPIARSARVCTASAFDPPEVRVSDYFWLLADTGSTATLTRRGDVLTVPVSGQLALHAAGCGPGRRCPVSVSLLEVLVDGEYELSGKAFSDALVLNPAPIGGASMEPQDECSSKFQIDSGVQVFVSGDLPELEPTRRGQLVESTGPLEGSVRWCDRVVTVDATFDLGAGVSLTLNLVTRFPNLSPRAEAGPDREVECTSPAGALVQLDGSGSTDPDDVQGTGKSDISRYQWSSADSNGHPGLNARGARVEVQVPLGQSIEPSLLVTDRSGSGSSDSVRVSVIDTAAPQVALTQDGRCMAPPDGSLRLFRLGTEVMVDAKDACSMAVSTRVVDVRADQPAAPTDFGFSDEAFCLRATSASDAGSSRRYIVTLESVDASGNTTRSVAHVDVPLSPQDCADPTSAPVAAEDDPRCGQPPPTAACTCRLVGTRSSSSAPRALLTLLTLGLVVWRRRR